MTAVIEERDNHIAVRNMEQNKATTNECQRLPSAWLLPFIRGSEAQSPVPSLPDSGTLGMIDSMLDEMGQVLREMDSQSREATETFTSLKKDIEDLLGIASPEEPVMTEVPPTLAQESEDFLYAFHLVGFPPTPLYVKRRFDISLKVTRRNGNVQDIDFPLYCYLSIQKMTPNSEEINLTRTGKPFLRGQLAQVFSEGPVLTFKNLVFGDISSQFPQGRVNLVVRCINNESIRPLLIEGVRVKARKKRPDEVI